MTRKQRRIVLIGSALGVLALAVGLVLNALRDSIVFFNSPTDVVEKQIEPGERIRLGGLVKEGSVERGENLAVRFDVTDGKTTITVAYQGLLPDLFREGQGVVTEGALDTSGTFKADSVLAKHDEAYMPKEVADALKKQGHWKTDGEKHRRLADAGAPAVIAELGHYALVLALALALVQSCVPLYGARTNDPALMAVGGPTALAQFLFVAISFGALVTCYLRSDFSVVNVFENSHSLKPLIYKITGVWGNHEGSMLLWVLILSLFGALVALFGGNLPARLRANVLSVQSWIAVAFVLFILMTSNPFLRIAQPPFEGRDLNPILQDPGLAIHPPMLYLGYVGLSISFSFAIAALIEGRIDAAWARWVRPWTLLAWIFLTLGIAMGSYWAYYTLGWGGWWFWDPVENASFMPWLVATALLHSAVVMEKRNALKIWTILLAIIAFSLSLIGTFLVRSGVLTSVHAFATDPTRGVFILAILVLFIGGGLALFALRAPLLRQGGLFAPISREGALVLNNLFLVTACATVFVGTLYPLALEALTGEKISVGAPFFNATFAPLFIPLLIAVPFGPLLAWKRGDLLGVAQRLIGAAAIAAVAIAVVFAMEGGGPVLVPFAIGLAFFVMAGAVTDIVERTGLLQGAALDRLRARLRSAAIGLGHGVCAFRARDCAARDRRRDAVGRSSASPRSSPDRPITIRRYELYFDGMTQRQGPNYRELAAHFTVRRLGEVVGVMEPSKRTFPSRNIARTTESALMTRGVSQLYLSLGDVSPDGSIAVRLYYKPLVLLIWLGPLRDGDRRRAVAVRPAVAGRCAAARQEQGRRWRRRSRAACGGCAFSWSRWRLLVHAPARAVQPDEVLADPDARSARTRPLQGTALHGLPESVDRRFGRAAGARSAHPGARAAAGGRQRRAGARFPGRALRRVRAAASRASAHTPRCSG